MEELLLSDFIKLCFAFKKDPTEGNETKLSDFVHQIKVASYMPIRKKQIAIAMILNCATFTEQASEREGSSFDITEITINTEAGKTIFGILAYALNLKNDLDNQALHLGIYDMLFQFGDKEGSLIDYILKFCRDDYARLEKMVAEAGNYSNLYRLSETAALMSPDNLNQFIDVISNMKDEMTMEKLQAMKDLMSTDDPAMTALKETLNDLALDKAMSKKVNNESGSKSSFAEGGEDKHA